MSEQSPSSQATTQDTATQTPVEAQPSQPSFEEFAKDLLDERLLRACEAADYSQPTPVQQRAIPTILSGNQDLLCAAATGSGKTAAFVLPVLQKLLTTEAPNTGTRALILVPTRELAQQIERSLKTLGRFTRIKFGLIMGGEHMGNQRAMIRKNPEILIATPGRLLEHITEKNPDFNDLEVLIFDEADRMLDMGFSDDVFRIAAACNPERQNLLFSATLSQHGLSKMAQELLNKPNTLEVDSARQKQAQIRQQVVLTDDPAHKQKLTLALLQRNDFNKALVFCNTRDMADKLNGYLRYKDISCGVLHGEMDQDERKYVMDKFRRGHFKVMVSTDVAARGLDIEGVELVINTDLARKADEYIHRIGRTGRAGREGLAISLVAPNDWNLKARIENFLNTQFEQIKVPGLEAKFKGPKKVKSNGKAVIAKPGKGKKGTKKTAAIKNKKGAQVKAKKRPANASKAKKPQMAKKLGDNPFASNKGEGMAPFKKR